MGFIGGASFLRQPSYGGPPEAFVATPSHLLEPLRVLLLKLARSKPKESKYPTDKVSGVKTISLMVFGTKVFKNWALGPSGN